MLNTISRRVDVRSAIIKALNPPSKPLGTKAYYDNGKLIYFFHFLDQAFMTVAQLLGIHPCCVARMHRFSQELI